MYYLSPAPGDSENMYLPMQPVSGVHTSRDGNWKYFLVGSLNKRNITNTSQISGKDERTHRFSLCYLGHQ